MFTPIHSFKLTHSFQFIHSFQFVHSNSLIQTHSITHSYSFITIHPFQFVLSLFFSQFVPYLAHFHIHRVLQTHFRIVVQHIEVLPHRARRARHLREVHRSRVDSTLDAPPLTHSANRSSRSIDRRYLPVKPTSKPHSKS